MTRIPDSPAPRYWTELLPIRIVLLLLLPLLAAGCLSHVVPAIAHNVVVKAKPKYSDTVAAWPKLNPDQGRVVIFYPRIGVTPLGAGDAANIKVDGKHKVSILDEQFTFIDLPAGEHSVSSTAGSVVSMMISGAPTVKFDLKGGETKYLKISKNFLKKGPPEIVPETEAQTQLKDLYHYSKTNLPFD